MQFLSVSTFFENFDPSYVTFHWNKKIKRERGRERGSERERERERECERESERERDRERDR